MSFLSVCDTLVSNGCRHLSASQVVLDILSHLSVSGWCFYKVELASSMMAFVDRLPSSSCCCCKPLSCYVDLIKLLERMVLERS